MAVSPHEVFTPAGAVSPGMFATRVHSRLEQRVADALSESGRQIALHGWTGVGKTSLLQYVCHSRDIECLQVECAGGYEAVMHSALSALEVLASKKIIERTDRAAELKGGPVPLLSGRLRSGQGNEEHFERYSGSMESVVVGALVESGVRVIFLDNLEDLARQEEELRGVCRLMKMCSGRSRELGASAPKVVLAGPTAITSELLLLDDAVDRRTTQIEVPRMPPEEIGQILARGEGRLGLVFDRACREQIVVNAGGFPYYAHLYALHASLTAARDQRDLVVLRDFYEALDEILDACSGTLKEAYGRAIRGQSPLRRVALSALARPDQVEVSMRQVSEAFLKLEPRYERLERVRFIGRVLKELEAEMGIVEKAWQDDGTPAYRFCDPLMRVYIRLRTLRDERDRAQVWRSSLPLSEPG